MPKTRRNRLPKFPSNSTLPDRSAFSDNVELGTMLTVAFVMIIISI